MLSARGSLLLRGWKQNIGKHSLNLIFPKNGHVETLQNALRLPVHSHHASIYTLSPMLSHPHAHVFKMNTGAPFNTTKRNHWYLKGKRTPRAPPTKHLDFDYSGDKIIGLPEVDKSLPRLGYEESDELKTADDHVRRIYSLEFANGTQVRNYCIEQAVKKVQKHEGDYISPEAKVATLTMKIRNQIKYCLERRKDKRAKSCLIERIQKRKKILKLMQRKNRDQFESLLEEFKIVYVPPPDYYRHVSYKRKLKKAAREKAMEMKDEKSKNFRLSIEKERQDFYAKKDEILADIEKQLKELNLDGPTFLQEVDEEDAKLGRQLNSKRYQFKQKFPAANNKYITMTIKQ
ncbi:small ribosomal subunit protein uS15m-like [Lineus longissimus]|uniref:small ribosomal subunit protein uS15m-like n=1 Tax=Lineus longissimus TaxID=88925 RepID=UPI002B4DD0B6